MYEYYFPKFTKPIIEAIKSEDREQIRKKMGDLAREMLKSSPVMVSMMTADLIFALKEEELNIYLYTGFLHGTMSRVEDESDGNN